MRTLVAAAVACLSLVSLSVAGDAQASIRKKISIPAQGLSTALQSFAQEQKLYLIYAHGDVSSHQTMGVSGELTQDEVLRQLLQDTGLTFQYLDENTVSILPLAAMPASSTKNSMTLGDSALRVAQSETESMKKADNTDSADKKKSDSDAEESANRIQEIVVTAQKREQRAQDVPMSITALSGKTLERQRLTDVQSLSFAVPGLTAYDIGGGKLSISIRGVDNTTGSTALTGMYMDEIPLAGTQGYSTMYMDVRSVDMQRVEVLKGPQGTLFGEGAVGGVIRYVTNKPDLAAAGGRISGTFYGTQDGGSSGQGSGVFNLPLVKDVLAIRVAANYENHAGWIDNVGTGEDDSNDSKLINGRLMTLWKPTENLTVTGLAQAQHNYGGAGSIVDLRPYRSSQFIQGYDVNFPTHFDSSSQIYNLAVNYDLGFANLLSSTSYWRVRSEASDTQYVLGTPPPGNPYGFFETSVPDSLQRQDVVSQEVRLTSSSAGPFNWVVGTQYKEDEVDSGDMGRGGFASVFYGALRFPSGQTGNLRSDRSRAWAVFGDVSYALAKRWEIGAGLRQYHDAREVHDIRGYARSADFSKLTYRAYTRYAATEDVNLYLNVSAGFRSGGFTGATAIASGAAPTYGPENALFYEAGVKTNLLSGRAALNFAVFQGNYTDQLQSFQSISTVTGNIFGYTVNAGDARIRGVEWQLDVVPIDNLTLSFGGDVLDTEFLKVSNAGNVFVGDPLPRTPEYVVQASANYKFDWTISIPGSIDVSYNRKGKAEAINRTNSFGPITTPSLPLDMLQLSVDAEWNDLLFTVFGTNLLDERDPLIPVLVDSVSQARPRTFGLTISKEF